MPKKRAKSSTPEETGMIIKNWADRTRVALVYPNTYAVGMSNLGFQTVYALINGIDAVVCERAFLPESSPQSGSEQAGPLRSVESGRPLTDFDIIAFSVSFESDFINLLSILRMAGVPERAEERNAEQHPLVMAGGVACLLNPEPIAPFIDIFLLGEGEAVIPSFFDAWEPERRGNERLARMAREIPGLYVPRFYNVTYTTEGAIADFRPNRDVPETISRVYVKDLSETPTCSTFLTPDTTFNRTWLVEVGRGCPHGCRFCSAGYIYRPPRFRSAELLHRCIAEGAAKTDRIGLMGAAVSDLPGLSDLCADYVEGDVRISFSSLRADALTPELLTTLKQSGVKTATIAPDAGSERMRRVINKGITEADILSAAESLVAQGIPNLKLYFMIGLPTETDDDVTAVIQLCKAIKARFLASSRAKGRIGEISVSLNPFVPKPFTPFQWAAMDTVGALKEKVRRIREGLRRVPNVRFQAEPVRHAHLQALMARGDRRTARLLEKVHEDGGNWSSALKASDISPEFYLYRERPADERFPWDFIDHGVAKSHLRREYERALAGKRSPDCPMSDDCELCGACAKEGA